MTYEGGAKNSESKYVSTLDELLGITRITNETRLKR